MSSKQICEHIELLNGDEIFLSMSVAAKKFNPPISPSTLQRFIRRGVRGVCLKTVLVGHRRFTTMSAIREFLHDQQNAAPERARPEASRTGMSSKMLVELSKKYRLPEPIQK